jgi:hypothetical protein
VFMGKSWRNMGQNTRNWCFQLGNHRELAQYWEKKLYMAVSGKVIEVRDVPASHGFFSFIYGYGSFPIHTIFSGMNIHKSQLFWCSPGVQGFDTLPYGKVILNHVWRLRKVHGILVFVGWLMVKFTP